MGQRREIPDWLGWAGVFAVIFGFDLWTLLTDRVPLSESFRTAPRWFTIPVTAYIVGHLFGLIPGRFDPLNRVGHFLSPDTVPKELVGGPLWDSQTS